MDFNNVEHSHIIKRYILGWILTMLSIHTYSGGFYKEVYTRVDFNNVEHSHIIKVYTRVDFNNVEHSHIIKRYILGWILTMLSIHT